MAEKVNTQEAESQEDKLEAAKSSETEVPEVTAPETDKPKNEEESDSLTKNDISDVIELLNYVDKDYVGGKGEIVDIPPDLIGSVRFLIEKLSILKRAYRDPYWAAINDDLVEQGNDGVTDPSTVVAIARNVPLSEIEEVADKENYGDVQKSVTDKVNKENELAAEDERIGMNFDKTKANFESYCKTNNYDEAEKSALWETVSMLMRVFGDGLLSENEFAEVDKMRNYDSDVAGIKAQLPADNKKEVLPDKASIDASINPSPKKPTAYQPSNQIESMAMGASEVDVTEIGKRKRMPGMRT